MGSLIYYWGLSTSIHPAAPNLQRTKRTQCEVYPLHCICFFQLTFKLDALSLSPPSPTPGGRGSFSCWPALEPAPGAPREPGRSSPPQSAGTVGIPCPARRGCGRCGTQVLLAQTCLVKDPLLGGLSSSSPQSPVARRCFSCIPPKNSYSQPRSLPACFPEVNQIYM